ncbi:hypothetical protein F5Y08DRAFT_305778 [Xylaria arbuscula]|nr:hypothetical protein F5Y08DRAFT_305778 [Xylaria arbuscula]
MRIMTAHTTAFFESSICPEPGAFTFAGLTILSIITIFGHFVISCAPTPASNPPTPDGHPEKIIKSIFYLVITTMLFVDGCWLTHIYSWGIRAYLTPQPQGIMECSFVGLCVAATILVLLPLSVLWPWTLWSMVSYLLKLWIHQHDSSDTSVQVLKHEIQP